MDDNNQPGGGGAGGDVNDLSTTAFLHHLLQSMAMNRHRATGDSNEELVANLKRQEIIKSDSVEQALLKIPRGIFVPDELQAEAYVDAPMRLAMFGFNISAPHMYAMCLEALNLEPGNTFLDIGSGCGHMTALGAYLVGEAGRADGIDLLPEYIEFAQQNVKRLTEQTGIVLRNCHFEIRNCFVPDIEERTYDRIHVGACCPTPRKDKLLELLNPGGILVTPMEDALVKITKTPNGEEIQKLAAVRYGDLKVPSEAEVKEAQLALERKKATTIRVPPDTFVSDFARLLNNEEMSDVKFVVDGKTIHAHKFILKVRSQHFKAMFSSGLRESRDSDIALHDTDYNAFLGCLQFIYSGHVPIPDADTAIELIAEANKLQLERLKALCEEVISKSISVENAAYVYQVASHAAAFQLKSLALDVILSNFADVSLTKCFAEMDRELVIEVTQEACKQLNKSRGNNTNNKEK